MHMCVSIFTMAYSYTLQGIFTPTLSTQSLCHNTGHARGRTP